MAKVVLGKGLKALISEENMNFSHDQDGKTNYQYIDQQTGKAGIIGKIPVSKIEPNPFQPRQEFEPHALEELKQSIIENGIIQPITVRSHGTGYQLVSGERRLRATKLAGFEDIPAYILKIETDREMLELALIENIQRERLNPIEVARGYERLISECQLTQEEVSKRVGKDRTTISNFLRLLKLPTQIQESLKQGQLSMGHARALLALDSAEAQLDVWQQVIKNGLSVRKVEALVQSYGKAKNSPKPVEDVKDVNTGHVEGKLRERFATKVKVQHSKKGNGQIVIEYYSVDDLERIMELIGAEH